jgi:hypothetical protein
MTADPAWFPYGPGVPLGWPPRFVFLSYMVWLFLAGYWIVDVDSEERALEIAAEASTAPGATVTAADGTPIQHLWIEVREILGSHKDL